MSHRNRPSCEVHSRCSMTWTDHNPDDLAGAIATVRQFVKAGTVPDFAEAVMKRIEQGTVVPAHDERSWMKLLRGLWTPRPVAFQFRPAYVLAAAVLVAWGSITWPTTPGVSPPTEHAARTFVQFRLEAPDASAVRLAGSFTRWEPAHQMHQVSPGVWTVTLPLAPGVHEYAFLIDEDRWVADPYAPAIQDGFGGLANRLALLPASEGYPL